MRHELSRLSTRVPAAERAPWLGAALRLAAGASLVACTARDDDSGIDPSAWEYQPDSVEGVSDPDQIQTEVQDLLDHILEFNGRDPLAAWFQVRRYGDDLCPDETTFESPENGDVVYFDRICVVQDRYWFKGPMTTYAFEQNNLKQFEVFDILPYLTDEEALWTGQAMKGQTDVYDTESDLDYNCSCTAVVAEAVDEARGARKWMTYTDGPTHYTAPEADADSWMNQGIQSHMFTKIKRDPSDDSFRVQLIGSVTGYEPVYGEIEMGIELIGSETGGTITCQTGLPESISVRHTLTGQRTTMDDLVVSEDCSMCTDLDGTEVCFDPTASLDWEDSPW